MDIYYHVRSSYGNYYRYVTDRKLRAAIEQLTGRRTISDADVRAFRVLGINFLDEADRPTPESMKRQVISIINEVRASRLVCSVCQKPVNSPEGHTDDDYNRWVAVFRTDHEACVLKDEDAHPEWVS